MEQEDSGLQIRTKEMIDSYSTSMEYTGIPVSRFKVPARSAKIKSKLFSLDAAEAGIYMLLFESNAKQITEIADLAGLTRTETYNMVSALQNKELVTATPKYPIRFSAVPLSD